MKVYFGAGIQGNANTEQRSERAAHYKALIEAIQSCGHEVIFEHTATNNRDEVWKILERQFGELPKDPDERGAFIRDKNIEAIEELADAVVLEVSTPSLGVGIEFAHAYLRPRMGLRKIPVLCLYQKGFWGHGLSIMVSGAAKGLSNVVTREYETLDHALESIREFFNF